MFSVHISLEFEALLTCAATAASSVATSFPELLIVFESPFEFGLVLFCRPENLAFNSAI